MHIRGNSRSYANMLRQSASYRIMDWLFNMKPKEVFFVRPNGTLIHPDGSPVQASELISGGYHKIPHSTVQPQESRRARRRSR